MNEHPSFEELSTYFDGEDDAFKSHIAACESCKETVASLEGDRNALRAAWAAPAMPEHLLDSIASPVPWWVPLRAPFAAAAAACVGLLLWGRGAAPRVEIPVELFVAAHNQYELTLPLAPTERILTEMPRGLALNFDPDQKKESGVY